MALMTSRRPSALDGDGVQSRGAGGRQTRARMLDVRVWGALLLLLVAAVLGAALLGRGSTTVPVLQAGRDLSVGSSPVGGVPVHVPADLAGAYLSADDPLDGRLRWPVAAGELIPRSALGTPAAEATRTVTVAVDPGHAPSRLAPGDRVDVWSTRADVGGLTTNGAQPTLVLADVSVIAVNADAAGFGGGLAVELSVASTRVGDLVAAARGGVVDLVAVPLSSQEVMP